LSTVAGSELADVQTGRDDRRIPLEAVGVSGLRYPICVAMRHGTIQRTICDAELTVPLDAGVRGTHMSRFVEALHDHRERISPATMLVLSADISERLDSRGASVTLKFPLFVDRPSPVTARDALLVIECRLAACVDADGSAVLEVGLCAPVTALCPCSKEIADYSAHSQRGHITITVVDGHWIRGLEGVWPQELLDVCDHAGSAPIYPLLKRADERHVTMLAYDHPAFVEDLVRDIAVALRGDERVIGFSVEAVNQESIHDHQAIARVSWGRS
jgi:GTP cyclohydrolase I